MGCFVLGFFGSFSVPFVTSAHSHIIFLYRKTDAVYCETHWQSPFSVSVQKPSLFCVVGTFNTVVFDKTLLLWACRDTVVVCVYPPTVTIVESLALILIYWLVNSSILTPQSFNLPKDCHYWSCSAWFRSYPALSMLATLHFTLDSLGSWK